MIVETYAHICRIEFDLLATPQSKLSSGESKIAAAKKKIDEPTVGENVIVLKIEVVGINDGKDEDLVL